MKHRKSFNLTGFDDYESYVYAPLKAPSWCGNAERRKSILLPDSAKYHEYAESIYAPLNDENEVGRPPGPRGFESPAKSMHTRGRKRAAPAELDRFMPRQLDEEWGPSSSKWMPYDPNTIAQDILRAMGKHPTLPPLNAHILEPLSKRKRRG